MRSRLLAAAVTVSVLALPNCTSSRDRDPTGTDTATTATPSRTAAPTDIASGGPSWPLPPSGDAPPGSQPGTGQLPASAGDDPFITVAALHSGRLVAMRLSALLDTATNGTPLRLQAVSPVVGAVSGTIGFGYGLLAVATNQPDVIAVDNFNTVKTVPLKQRLGAAATDLIDYGPPVRHGDAAVLPLGVGKRFALVRINLRSLTVERHAIFDNHGNAGRACLTGRGELAVITRNLSFVDPATLTITRTTAVPGHPATIACTPRGIWVGDYLDPVLRLYGDDGQVKAEARWTAPAGENNPGTVGITYDPTGRSVIVTDGVGGHVIACNDTGRCQSSEQIPGNPTDLLLVGKYLLVTLQDGKRVGVIDRATLKPIGAANLHDLTRAIGVLPAPPLTGR